ncbi:alanine/glycine:cation symporter family protein [Peptacetobacter hiranonis]|uniref:alanine/glycine:cation symporter family protein n=1 Tax=Peptacetobacter hiranonis TaxID=89152 RepID=UPI0022E927EC|nr:sodium:alanine symporter family protein [Peptacetobacter hiranonis]
MELFLDNLLEVVVAVNGFLWNFLLLFILCGVGIYYTFKLKFIQVRKFGEGFRLVFGNLKLNGEKKEHGEMTPFQSLATAIAAQVGTGNLTGAATALLSGGPGAIFWMWLSAFFGMATIYSEATLAQKYKTVVDGEVTGGPVYYIRAAFTGKFGKVLAATFSVLIILALGFMGNMVQSNSIGAAFSEVFASRNLNIPPITVGLLIAVVAGFVFIGGTQRLASVVEKIVPIMAFVYIIGSLALIGMNISEVPEAFKMIIVGAFNPKAVLGGAVGISIKEAIRYGVARGLFSNEAGMGSTPHAHARAAAKNPHEQGLTAMVSVFIDTFIILNLTAFSILTSGVLDSGKEGIALTQTAFVNTFGSSGDIFIAVCLLFFAFSTILGWHFFGRINVKYLFGQKAVKIYSLIVILFIIVGSTLKVELVWQLADCFNGLMVIPNAIALFALSGVVMGIYKKYGSNDSDKNDD